MRKSGICAKKVLKDWLPINENKENNWGKHFRWRETHLIRRKTLISRKQIKFSTKMQTQRSVTFWSYFQP